MVVLSPEIFGLQPVGGISRYFVELQRALRADGCDAVIHAGHHLNAHLADAGPVIGRPTGRARLPRWLRHWNEARFQAWCASRREPPVVHRTFYGRDRRPRCRRLVVTVHDMIPELLFPDWPGVAEGSAQKRRACADADAVCVNSRTTARDLMRLWDVPASRIWVTPLGVRPVPPSARDWRASHGRFLLFVGQRGGYKNARRLVEAFAAARIDPAVRLLCFGGSPPSDDERAHLGHLGVGHRVDFVGGDDADLAACYRQAVALVCPSLYEGFGLPLVEAMSHRCPVVCSDRGSLPEVAGDAALYADPEDVDAMRDLLERVADPAAAADPAGRERLDRGEARARRFGWDTTARATRRAYDGMHTADDVA